MFAPRFMHYDDWQLDGRPAAGFHHTHNWASEQRKRNFFAALMSSVESLQASPPWAAWVGTDHMPARRSHEMKWINRHLNRTVMCFSIHSTPHTLFGLADQRQQQQQLVGHSNLVVYWCHIGSFSPSDAIGKTTLQRNSLVAENWALHKKAAKRMWTRVPLEINTTRFKRAISITQIYKIFSSPLVLTVVVAAVVEGIPRLPHIINNKRLAFVAHMDNGPPM